MLKYLNELLAQRDSVPVFVRTVTPSFDCEFELIGADSAGVLLRSDGSNSLYVYPWQAVVELLIRC